MTLAYRVRREKEYNYSTVVVFFFSAHPVRSKEVSATWPNLTNLNDFGLRSKEVSPTWPNLTNLNDFVT